jgi:3D (Asp-Asp-Asp) domain-containing protein
MTIASLILKFALERMKTIASTAALVAVTMASVPLQIQTADADASTATAFQDPSSLVGEFVPAEQVSAPEFSVPSYTRVKALRTYRYVPMTAYTSRPEETDSTPFITADGSHVRDGIVAANFLPFGTKVRIPELFGDKIFEVHDRMNKRYPYKMDFWMEDYGEAIRFGVRYAHVEVVETEEAGG